MDPYLEDPHRWPDTHSRLINALSELLAPQLRPKYYVRIEMRDYISDEDDPARETLIPDLRISSRAGLQDRPHAPEGRSDLAVLEPVIITALSEEEMHEARLVVFDRESRQLVAVLEVLSPSNKVKRARGRENYREKRREVLISPSHFIEIDLLRAGVPLIARHLLPPHDYLVHVSRASRRPKGEFWPIPLRQRLPVISVPLLEADADAKLDLQEALDLVYERAGYDLDIDYGADAVPPLRGDAVTWAAELLTAKGLRKDRPRRRGSKR
jgi:hypothetical protein